MRINHEVGIVSRVALSARANIQWLLLVGAALLVALVAAALS